MSVLQKFKRLVDANEFWRMVNEKAFWYEKQDIESQANRDWAHATWRLVGSTGKMLTDNRIRQVAYSIYERRIADQAEKDWSDGLGLLWSRAVFNPTHEQKQQAAYEVYCQRMAMRWKRFMKLAEIDVSNEYKIKVAA